MNANTTKDRPRKKKRTDPESTHGQKNLLLVLEKKKRSNARAQLLVEEFIDLITDAERFLENLQYISQSHYEDIVEERSIIRNCGYPFCANILENIPKKQYHICRNSNTVFDITERKKFCSTDCYRASKYIHAQLLTSPLWLRDSEPIPLFELMPDWRSPVQLSVPKVNSPQTAKNENATAVKELNTLLKDMSLCAK